MIVKENSQFFAILLYLCLIAFKNREDALKRGKYRIVIWKKSAMRLLFLKKQELQCNGLTSNVNIRIRFYWRQFFLFCFCETDFYVFTLFFKFANFIWNIFSVEIYIPMESSNLSLTKYTFISWKRKRKRWSLNGYKGSFSQNFPLV